MSRFLFVVPPLAGHTYPTIPVGYELQARGHEVAWAGYEPVVSDYLPDDARLFPTGGDEVDAVLARAAQRPGRGAGSFTDIWNRFFIPLTKLTVPDLEAVVDEFHPSVLVVDHYHVAGAIVARRRGLPWATSATLPVQSSTQSPELTASPGDLPKFGEWINRRLHELQLELGVPDDEARRGDLCFSDRLVLAFTTEALVGELRERPDHYALVGPSIGIRAGHPDFPWAWIDPGRRLVLVSLGTINRDIGASFYATAVDALAPLGDRLQVVLAAPPQLFEAPPAHVLVRDHVPQLELLPRVAAVVCHGGHNSVCESLAHAIPLVVAPIRDDQPVVARQVTEAGAGIRVNFRRVGPPELRDAVLTVLDDPSYRRSAERVRDSFAAAGGAPAAADHLERIL